PGVSSMTHGVQGYFIERRRAQRRVALLAAGLAAFLFAPLIALQLGLFERPVRQFVDETARFGYAGSDQFVRRIMLQQMRGMHAVTEMGRVDTHRSQAGGGQRARKLTHDPAPPQVRRTFTGPGTVDADMTEHSVSRLANVPVVHSEDLIIE